MRMETFPSQAKQCYGHSTIFLSSMLNQWCLSQDGRLRRGEGGYLFYACFHVGIVFVMTYMARESGEGIEKSSI